jgi:hypothetical protein
MKQILKLFANDDLQRAESHIPFKLLKTYSSFLIVTDTLTSASAKMRRRQEFQRP